MRGELDSLDSPAMHHADADSHRPPDDSAQGESSTLAWIGPFVVFMAWLAVDKVVPLANPWKELVRDAVLLVAIFAFSRRLLPSRAPYWLSSIAVGLGVFVLWVAPD